MNIIRPSLLSALILLPSLPALAEPAAVQPAAMQPATMQSATTRPTEMRGVDAEPMRGQMRYGMYPGVGAAYQSMQNAADLPGDQATIVQQSSCVLQIDVAMPASSGYGYNGGFNNFNNEQFVNLDATLAQSLMTSTTIIDEAAADALDMTPAQAEAQVRVSVSLISPRQLRSDITLHSGTFTFAKDAASKLQTQLFEHLKRAFLQSADARNRSLRQQAADNDARIAALKKSLTDVRAKLHADQDATSSVLTVYGDPSNTRSNIRMQRQQLKSDLDRNQTRLSSIAPDAANPLVTEWESLVKEHQEKLKTLTASQRNGSATASEVSDEQSRLSDAQGHLAAATIQAQNTNNPNTAYQAREATQVKATISDEQSRMAQLDEQLKKLDDPHFVQMFDEQRDLQSREQTLNNQLSSLMSMSPLADAPLGQPQVTITVLDGKGD